MEALATPAVGAAAPDAPSTAASSSSSYRPEIDGLRALAVAAVILSHVGFPSIGGGFVGVDVFFVISGYLITGILKRELDAGAFSLRSFYERRVRRIVPALVVMSAAVAWATYTWLPPRELIAAADALASVGLFVSNIYFYLHSGYWDAASRDHPLLHTWSLGVEEQFYIIFPLVLAAIHRWVSSPRSALAALAAVSLAGSAWAASQAPQAGFYLLPFRAFELIIGALLAYDAVTPPSARWMRELTAAAGLALILAAVFAFSEATPFPGVAALAPCLGAGMIILSGSGGPSLTTGLLATAPARFVGLVSYSLYLWHWPVFVFARAALGRPFSLGDKLWLVGVAFALAVISWALVERPFRRRSGRFATRAGAFALAAAGAILGLAAAEQATAHHGWGNRLPPGLAELDSTGEQLWRRDSCLLDSPAAWKQDQCVIAGARPERVLWWGDSFAAQYVPALLQLRARLPFSVVQYNDAGCAPVFGFQPQIAPHCRAFNDNAFNVIAANHVRVVVLVARWEEAMRRGLSLAGLTRTVEVLRGRGLTVVVIGQSPVFAANAVRILAWRRVTSRDPVQTEPVVFAPDFNSQLRDAAVGAVFIDPMPPLCQGQNCQLGDGRQAYFIDDGHLSLAGALKALPPIVDLIARTDPAPGTPCAASGLHADLTRPRGCAGR